MKQKNLSVLHHNVSKKVNCSICNAEHLLETPFAVFQDSDLDKPICDQCREKHAPGLRYLLNCYSRENAAAAERELKRFYQERDSETGKWKLEMMIEEVKESVNMLDQCDLENLSSELSDLSSYVIDLFDFATYCNLIQRIKVAQKAIDPLLKEGISFEEIRIFGK